MGSSGGLSPSPGKLNTKDCIFVLMTDSQRSNHLFGCRTMLLHTQIYVEIIVLTLPLAEMCYPGNDALMEAPSAACQFPDVVSDLKCIMNHLYAHGHIELMEDGRLTCKPCVWLYVG